MKKSLIIALVGIVLFAFASCAGETNKGSKEFRDAKAFIEKFEKAVSAVTTCEELNAVGEQMETEAWGLAMQSYDENEKLTSAEEEELTKLSEKWVESIQKKYEELGCEDTDDVEVEEIDVVEVEE
ncbi:MAG: hypothetical protein J6X10_08060 [Bacteroidales bacterium]|nr:hypothetical protein [Bacteroidales bacterium]